MYNHEDLSLIYSILQKQQQSQSPCHNLWPQSSDSIGEQVTLVWVWVTLLIMISRFTHFLQILLSHFTEHETAESLKSSKISEDNIWHIPDIWPSITPHSHMYPQPCTYHLHINIHNTDIQTQTKLIYPNYAKNSIYEGGKQNM